MEYTEEYLKDKLLKATEKYPNTFDEHGIVNSNYSWLTKENLQNIISWENILALQEFCSTQVFNKFQPFANYVMYEVPYKSSEIKDEEGGLWDCYIEDVTSDFVTFVGGSDSSAVILPEGFAICADGVDEVTVCLPKEIANETIGTAVELSTNAGMYFGVLIGLITQEEMDEFMKYLKECEDD